MGVLKKIRTLFPDQAISAHANLATISKMATREAKSQVLKAPPDNPRRNRSSVQASENFALHGGYIRHLSRKARMERARLKIGFDRI